MQTYLKSRPAGIQLLLFLGMAFGIFMVLSLIGVVILSKITGLSALSLSDTKNWNSGAPGMIVFIRGMLLIQFFGLFVIPSLLFAYFSDPKPLNYLGLNKPGKFSYWLIAIALLLLAVPLVEFTGILNREINFGTSTQQWIQSMEEQAAQQIKFMLNRKSETELLMNIIFIAAFAGVGEELFFRGVLQRILIKAFKNAWMGIVVAAILFSFFHFQFFGFIPRLFLGALLGAIYWYSGSLWPAIIAHFAYDAFFIILVYFQPQLLDDAEANLFQQSQLAMLALISAALVAFLVWLMIKKSTVTYESVYKDDNPPPPQNFSF